MDSVANESVQTGSVAGAIRVDEAKLRGHLDEVVRGTPREPL